MKRVFIGLSPTAGYYYSLYEGLRERNDVRVTLLYRSHHRFGYDKRTQVSWLQRWFYFVHKELHPISPVLYYVLKLVSLILIFPYIFFRHDVFIFASGNSFFRERELPLYGFFRKKIIAVFTGSDIRPSYINLHKGYDSTADVVNFAKKQKEKVEKFEKNNAVIISHPTISYFQTKPYLLWLNIGFPKKIVFDSIAESKEKENNEIWAIHSPSNPKLKGTEEIKKLVDELNQENSFHIHLDILGNVDSDVLYQKLKSADFLIDQMYIDTPLGGLSTEAAVLNTPAIVGGYYAEDIRSHYAEEVIPPSMYVLPSDMKESIRKMAEDSDFREKVAYETNQFVHQKWSIEKVANNYMRIINDDIPTEWWGYPNDVQDIYPIGQMKYTLETIREILNKYGLKALYISDKPHLEKKIQEHVEELVT